MQGPHQEWTSLTRPSNAPWGPSSNPVAIGPPPKPSCPRTTGVFFWHWRSDLPSHPNPNCSKGRQPLQRIPPCSTPIYYGYPQHTGWGLWTIPQLSPDGQIMYSPAPHNYSGKSLSDGCHTLHAHTGDPYAQQPTTYLLTGPSTTMLPIQTDPPRPQASYRS
jgi:hypothetical protein